MTYSIFYTHYLHDALPIFLPISTELYQSGLGAQALWSLSSLAQLVGKDDTSKELEQTFAEQKTFLNQTFWSAEKKLYSFADRKSTRLNSSHVSISYAVFCL